MIAVICTACYGTGRVYTWNDERECRLAGVCPTCGGSGVAQRPEQKCDDQSKDL